MAKGKSKQILQELRQCIASNLAALREEKGLTFEALAQQTGVHSRHLQKIEAGESNITLATISRLANGLGVSVEALITKV